MEVTGSPRTIWRASQLTEAGLWSPEYISVASELRNLINIVPISPMLVCIQPELRAGGPLFFPIPEPASPSAAVGGEGGEITHGGSSERPDL